jgi:hypothetical protein
VANNKEYLCIYSLKWVRILGICYPTLFIINKSFISHKAPYKKFSCPDILSWKKRFVRPMVQYFLLCIIRNFWLSELFYNISELKLSYFLLCALEIIHNIAMSALKSRPDVACRRFLYFSWTCSQKIQKACPLTGFLKDWR